MSSPAVDTQPQGTLTPNADGAPEGAAAPHPHAPAGGRRRMGRDAIVYGLGIVLSRAASMIMLPVYTRMLTPADYGLLQMLDMTADVVAILVSAGCTEGVMRFYFKAQTDLGRKQVLGSALALLIGLNAIGSVLLALFAGPIWQHALHGAGSVGLVYIAAANFTLGSLITVPLLKMQIEQRAALYSTTTVARLVFQLSCNILFLVVFRMGPLGILVSSLLANVIIGGGAVAWMIRRDGLHVSGHAFGDLRRFGVPIQIAMLGNFLLTFGDRFFIDRFSGLAAVGLYSLGYQFGFIMDQIGCMPYMRAWIPRRFAAVTLPRAERDAANVQGFLYLNLVLITVATGIAVFVHPLLRIMSAPAFWSASSFVPIILAAYVIQAWTAVTQIGIDVSERTRYYTVSVWASVAAVVVLYSVLIPPFGAIGAAWATLISFTIKFGLVYRFSHRLWPIAYGWRRVLLLSGWSMAAAIGAIVLRPAGLGAEIAVGVGLVGAYFVGVWTTVMHDEDRRAIQRFVLGRVRAALPARLALR